MIKKSINAGIMIILTSIMLSLSSWAINAYASSDLTITTNWTLDRDETVQGSMFQNSGDVNLNGHRLTVEGSLTQSGGNFTVNGGKVVVNGDYSIQSKGRLIMTNSLDYVLVKGNFYIDTKQSSVGYLTAGTLEVKGNFLQYNSYYTYDNSNFYSTGTHKVILSGSGKQTVQFKLSTTIYAYDNPSLFNILQISNTSVEGVNFYSKVYVSKELKSTSSVCLNTKNIELIGNAKISGYWKYDLTLWNLTIMQDGVVGGDVYIDSSKYLSQIPLINLNGKSLTVRGNFYSAGIDFDINKGKLIVEKNFWQSSGTVSANSGQILVSGDFHITNTGILRMQSNQDYIMVKGNFSISTDKSSIGYLTAGTLEVKGDFTRSNSGSFDNYNFVTSGTHKVILSGEKKQTISFQQYSNWAPNSHFNILIITKPLADGYSFDRISMWNTLISQYDYDSSGAAPTEVTGPQKQELCKDIKIKADKEEMLANGKVKYSGNVKINDYLKLDGSLTVDKENLQMDGEGLLYIETTLPHYHGTINLFKGSFTINADAAELLKQTGYDKFEIAGIKVKITKLQLLMNGIRIAGSLSLPDNVGGLSVNVDNLEIVNGIPDVDGKIILPDLELGKTSIGLKDACMEFNTKEDKFEGHACLEIPNMFGIEGTVGVKNAELDKVGFGLDGLSLAIDASGFYIQKIYGEVAGLSEPPLKLKAVTSIAGGPEIADTNLIIGEDLTIEVDMSGVVKGSGKLKLLNYDLANASFGIGHAIGFELEATLNAMDIIESNVKLSANKDSFEGSGKSIVKVPADVPFVGGKVVTGSEISFDKDKIKGSLKFGLADISFWMDYKYNWGFNTNIDLFRKMSEVPQASKGIQDLGQNTFEVPSGLKQAIIRFTWTSGNTDFSITGPDGKVIAPGDAPLTSAFYNYVNNKSKNEAFYIISNPVGGQWQYQLTNSDITGLNVEVYSMTPAPTLELTAPANDINTTTAGGIDITWTTNADNGSTLDLYYSESSSDKVGKLIAEGIDPILGSCNWNLANVPGGNYYIFGKLNSTKNAPVYSYAKSKVTVVNPENPSVPTGLTGKAVNGQIILYWNANTESDLAGYKIHLDDNTDPFVIGRENTYIFKGLQTDTNHKISISAYNDKGYESDKSSTVQVYLPTPVPPALDITWPIQNVTNFNLVDIKGQTDTTASAIVYCNHSIVSSGQSGNFYTTVCLTLGDNIIKVISTKSNGDASEESREYFYDPTAPQLTLDNIYDGMTIDGDTLTITGSTEPTSNLVINGNTVVPDTDGKFQTTINLLPGTNDIDITATDEAGNQSVFYGTINNTSSFKISSSDPQNGDENVPVDKSLTVNFNKNIISSDNYGDITLKDESGNIVEISAGIQNNMLTLKHAGSLKFGKTYTLTIPETSVEDEHGNSLSSSYSITFKTEMPIHYGDVDGDGNVTVNDILLVKQYLLGIIPGFSEDIDKIQADVDGDGRITSTDYALIKRRINGKIDKFPAEKDKVTSTNGSSSASSENKTN